MSSAETTRAAMAVTTATLGQAGRTSDGADAADTLTAVGEELDGRYDLLCFGFLHVIQALLRIREHEQGAPADDTLALIAEALGHHP